LESKCIEVLPRTRRFTLADRASVSSATMLR
jgi:hypothetical protein